jgi:hypothetical protein
MGEDETCREGAIALTGRYELCHEYLSRSARVGPARGMDLPPRHCGPTRFPPMRPAFGDPVGGLRTGQDHDAKRVPRRPVGFQVIDTGRLGRPARSRSHRFAPS